MEWLEFPDVGFVGLLQEQVAGRVADFTKDPRLIEPLIALLDHLHHDDEVRLRLNAPPKTYFDHFAETYIERFSCDLEGISEDRISFISSKLIAWMRDETSCLREIANHEQAFHQPAVEPVHGDLNEYNVLIAPNDWFVVDWDDLTLGDPAVDFAILLWPMIYAGGDWRRFALPGADGGFTKRIEICLRAQLFDEVVDPLADYIEAQAVPARMAEVQLAKRKRHEEALDRYRALWGREPAPGSGNYFASGSA